MLKRLSVSLPMVMPAVGGSNAYVMPNFSRKPNVLSCHTIIPRLNETGYKFRAAGFSFPEETGKADERKFELGDYLAAGGQARYDTQITNQPNRAPVANVIGGVAGPRTVTNAFSFIEFTAYPLTGSWGKYSSSLSGLSFAPEDFKEVETAYVRFNYGTKGKFFPVRGGVFHAWEGFGACDRPFSNARALFQACPISPGGRAVPYLYQPWGLDEASVEFRGDINKFSLVRQSSEVSL